MMLTRLPLFPWQFVLGLEVLAVITAIGLKYVTTLVAHALGYRTIPWWLFVGELLMALAIGVGYAMIWIRHDRRRLRRREVA